MKITIGIHRNKFTPSDLRWFILMVLSLVVMALWGWSGLWVLWGWVFIIWAAREPVNTKTSFPTFRKWYHSLKSKLKK